MASRMDGARRLARRRFAGRRGRGQADVARRNFVGGVFVQLEPGGLAAHWHLTKTHHTPQETLNLVLFRAANDGQGFSRLALNAAKACATVVVTTWNFTAAKFFTFKD